MAAPTNTPVRGDRETRDLACVPLQLTEGLLFSPQRHGGEQFYHIEHATAGRFFRVGYAEYALISLFDGRTSLAQALTLLARRLGAQAPNRRQGLETVQWLIAQGLARRVDESGSAVTRSARAMGATAAMAGERRGGLRLNPFWTRIPCGSPDRLLRALLPVLGWLFSPGAMLLGLVALVAAGVSLASQWERFVADSAAIFTLHNGPWLAAAWLALKVAHELGHGLACRRHGGEVREAGIVLVLLAPMAYVDVTSCWRFPSKWQRIQVALAGMYVELLLAALAIWVWSQASSELTRHALVQVIVMAGATTVLFNINPLMRFDGYYLLADALEFPNLYEEGDRYVRSLASHWFLGVRGTPLRWLGARGWLVRLYGFAALVWRTTVCVSLLVASAVWFHGAGVLLAIAGAIGWLGRPLAGAVGAWLRQWRERPAGAARGALLAAGLLALASALLAGLPWPGGLAAPAVVDYADLSLVRSRASGFISRIHVADGQLVTEGTPLLELTNDELESDVVDLRSRLEQERLRLRFALDEHDPLQTQIAEGTMLGLEQQLAEAEQRRAGLRVVAPVAGRVVARGLEQRLGTHVREGQELLAVGDEHRKELVVSIGQEDLDEVLPRVGEPIRFRLGAGPLRSGRLERLVPRASTALPHPAFSSLAGGALAVRPREEESRSGESMRLVEARFRGVVIPDEDERPLVAAGERGQVLFGARRDRLGPRLWREARRWLDAQVGGTLVGS